MATPTIPNGEEYFFPIIYEGNGAGQRVGKFVPFTDSGTIDIVVYLMVQQIITYQELLVQMVVEQH